MTPYDMLVAARVAPGLPALTHAVVRLIPGRVGGIDRWELGGMTGDLVSASALADSMAALYPPDTTAQADGTRTTPGPWEVAELRGPKMGGEQAVPVHTGTARELISPRELDAVHDLMADCRELLDELADGAPPADVRTIAREMVERLDELMPDEHPAGADRPERFTPHEPESMPD